MFGWKQEWCRRECLLLPRSSAVPAHLLPVRNPLSQAVESLDLLELYALILSGLEVSLSKRCAPN